MELVPTHSFRLTPSPRCTIHHISIPSGACSKHLPEAGAAQIAFAPSAVDSGIFAEDEGNFGGFDVRLTLKGNNGGSLILELGSEVLTTNSVVFADLVADYLKNSSSLCRIEVPNVENLNVFRETFELMFEEDISKKLLKIGVFRAIDILECFKCRQLISIHCSRGNVLCKILLRKSKKRKQVVEEVGDVEVDEVEEKYKKKRNHFGKLKGDKVFNDLFNKCMSGCTNEGQFEECWSSMISTYCLQDNSWFRRLYGIREKWSTAFNKDFFSTGTVTSQRSESTNHSIGFKAKPTTSLSEFYNGAFKQMCWVLIFL
ncbi:hypothetical protein CASFOL_002190 [Castilleja foliolosa]|uniref:Protein FAR1-RELATED SEQUENCE n=1 Tax=Castilleja foliolosa TaxID=1961234 RepID=A0ABD3EH54_9LAMI